jgi:hypothetical protein
VKPNLLQATNGEERLVSVVEERLPQIEGLQLEAGGHEPPDNGLVHACVMEAVSYVANEPWSDHPECASAVIGAFLRSWNDRLSDDDRQMLKPLIPRLVGTKASARVEEKRAWMATDWLARECAPAFLRLAGLTEHAEALEGLAALTTTKWAEKAQATLAAAGAAARAAAGAAAGDAAGAAAWDAARAAAGAAARAAAGAAAWDAARAAAWAAAWAAARAAAGAAAWDALEPAVKQLQSSALLLVERMIEA